MEIKKGRKDSTDDFWYDLTDGGYLKPDKICKYPEDAKKVIDAIEVLEDFRQSCEEQIPDFIR
jgi:hypothetical protein